MPDRCRAQWSKARPEVVADPAGRLERRLLLEHLERQAGQAVEEHQADRVAAPHLLQGHVDALVGQPRGVRLDARLGALGQVADVLAADLDVADEQLGEVEADRLRAPEAEVDEREPRVALTAQEVVGTGVAVRGEVRRPRRTRRASASRRRATAVEAVAQAAEVLGDRPGGATWRRRSRPGSTVWAEAAGDEARRCATAAGRSRRAAPPAGFRRAGRAGARRGRCRRRSTATGSQSTASSHSDAPSRRRARRPAAPRGMVSPSGRRSARSEA